MEVLKPPFNTRDSAIMMIRENITEFYRDGYPEIYENHKAKLEMAIEGLIEQFNQYSFPEMHVYHNTYTDHIGHQESLGCFRCHSGRHESETGGSISKDCNLCHEIIAQCTDTSLMTVGINEALEFKHPVDVDGAWREFACSECHSDLY